MPETHKTITSLGPTLECYRMPCLTHLVQEEQKAKATYSETSCYPHKGNHLGHQSFFQICGLQEALFFPNGAIYYATVGNQPPEATLLVI